MAGPRGWPRAAAPSPSASDPSTADPIHGSLHTAAPPATDQRTSAAKGTPSARTTRPRVNSSAHAAGGDASRLARGGRATPGPRRAIRSPPRKAPSRSRRRRHASTRTPASDIGGRPAERGPVLRHDRGREGLEADHREGAVLGEQVQADEERATQDRQPQLWQHDARVDPPGRAARQRRDILERRVQAPQDARRPAGRRAGSRTAS